MNIKYQWLPAGLIEDGILEECSALYSNHYGYWGASSPHRPGERIKLSSQRIRTWLSSDESALYYARNDEQLIGYAIAIKLKIKKYGMVSWVTQLVVHEDFRHQGIAKTLLFHIWGLSDHYAWGVISANPFAIRALEKSTRRRCRPQRIAINRRKLFSIGIEHLPYVNSDTQLEVNKSVSRIYSHFYVDHSNLEKMIQAAVAEHTPWLLGKLDEGWEWFAFTFNDQDKLKLTAEEIDNMISASEEMTRVAYSRMLLDGSHKWLQHTESEVDFIMENCSISEGDLALDIGCGNGRHAISLASKGIQVTGVDYISDFIQKAQSDARKEKLTNLEFILADSRNLELDQKYDAVICLYDVIGTFVEFEENIKILKTISNRLKTGGRALISVMNYELTRNVAKNVFSFASEPNRLLDLAPGHIMEETGNIFDPNFFLVDESTHVVYRKEQFTQGDSLPIELIVRDKRFKQKEIVEMCIASGLAVEWTRFVSSGSWSKPLDPLDKRAKEILVLCTKR